MTRKTPRGLFGRVFLLAASAGFVLGLLGIIARGAPPLDALFITILSAGPAILLSAALAGVVAFSGSRADSPWSQSTWLVLGLSAGTVSGALSLAVWIVVMTVDADAVPSLNEVAIAAAPGAVAGAVAGLLVALYCWRAMHARRKV